jgi:hypothetical protein
MRTTPREKLVLWLNGLALFICLELLLRLPAGPLSLMGLAVIVPVVATMALITVALLRRAPRA